MKRRFTIERIPGPLASLYEKASRLVIKSYYSQVAEEILSTFHQGLLLDLGTGPGYLPIEIVKRSPHVRIIGVDLSRVLIRMARANALRAGYATRVHFEVGNAANLRFEKETFDGVISTGMLHVLREPVSTIRECWRVLKPGQEAWIYDPARVCSQVDVAEWKASLSPFERLMDRFLPLFARLNPPRAYTRKQVEEWIGRTSFKDYSVEEHGTEIKIRLRKQVTQ
ncbi:MAG: putative methyltransferase [Deltaproteobacteria bacterium]|nr:putative methyltransferase [Deltaproteobacteria bacterium]